MLRRMEDRRSSPVAALAGRAGRICCGLAMLGFAAEHWVTRSFATRVLPPWPAASVHPRLTAWLAALVGLVLATSGLAILARRRSSRAGVALAVLFGGGLLLVGIPRALAHWRVGAAWTNPCKVLVLVGGALLVAALGDRGPSAEDAGGHAWTFCRSSLALFLTVGGVQHFVYADFVRTLVPGWIPGALFWTYAAGLGLIAAGVGFAVPRAARLAGLGAGATIFSWFLILHIPRAVAAWSDAGEWSGVAESLAIAGIAWLVAGARPRLTEQSRHALKES